MKAIDYYSLLTVINIWNHHFNILYQQKGQEVIHIVLNYRVLVSKLESKFREADKDIWEILTSNYWDGYPIIIEHSGYKPTFVRAYFVLATLILEEVYVNWHFISVLFESILSYCGL